MADNKTTEQEKFDDLVTNLIKTTDVLDFNGALLEGLEHQTSDFWRYMIDYMYHEYEDQYLGHAPIQENDFPGTPSFVEFLNQYIDLDNDTNRNTSWSTIWQQIKANAISGDNQVWNESLANIIKTFVNAFDSNGRIYIRGKEGEEGSVYISIYDIMHANAGHKFFGNDNTNDWVIPNINVDNETYGEVREGDKIVSVLNNDEELQFTSFAKSHYSEEDIKTILTNASQSALKVYSDYGLGGKPWETAKRHITSDLQSILDFWKIKEEEFKEMIENGGIAFSQALMSYARDYPEKPEYFNGYPDIKYLFQASSWLRLLMPKYLRKVEVEDLNRNFWVLGQTMSAVCAFLFGPNAPFAKLFEDMAAEITQLWENILYLWLAFAMATQKPEITDTHVEVVYIPNSELELYLKFDNFDNGEPVINDSFWNAIKSKCNYIVQQHSDSHVVIIPKIRCSNYKHNFYTKEIWPGILYYNRTTNVYTYSVFQVYKKALNTDSWGIESTGIVINASSTDHFNACWTLMEDEFNYSFVPARTVLNDSSYQSQPYYILLRTKPSVNTTYLQNNHRIHLDSFSLRTYDVATKLLMRLDEGCIDYYHLQTGYDDQSAVIQIYHEIERTAPEMTIDSVPPETIDTLPHVIPIKMLNEGFYQGEFPSYLASWVSPDPEPEIDPSPVTYDADFITIQLNPSVLINDDLAEIYQKINTAYEQGATLPDINSLFQQNYNTRMSTGYMNNTDYTAVSTDTDNGAFETDITIPQNDLGLKPFDEKIGNWDHSNCDVGKSFYNWEAANIVNSLIRKQYLSHESGVSQEDAEKYISGDVYALFKYAQANPPVQTENSNSFAILIGTHQVQLWRDAWNDPAKNDFNYENLSEKNGGAYTVYSADENGLISNSWDDTDRSKYPAIQYYINNAFAIQNGALLHRYPNQSAGLAAKDIVYGSFYGNFYGPSGYLTYHSGKYTHFDDMSQMFTLIRSSDNNVLGEDNWINMLITYSGGRDSIKGKSVPVSNYASKNIYQHDFSNDESAADVLLTQNTIYFFFPDGKCVYAVIDRYRAYGYKECYYENLTNFTEDKMKNWIISYHGDFSNNKQVFLQLYNYAGFLADNLQDYDNPLFGKRTQHHFNNVSYSFSPYEDFNILDPILYPNTLIKNAEGNRESTIIEAQ